MEKEQKPISMKNLNKNESSTLKIVLITILLTIMSILSFEYMYNTVHKRDINIAKTITLDDVIVATAPETKKIVLLDRKTEQVKFALSDSIALAIYALKSAEVSADYNLKVTK